MSEILKSLNTQQAEAVTQLAGPILILAGAGSGKTKALTVRIAYMLEQGVRPSSILAITFTNKAAKEMRQRVDKLVGENAKNVWLYTFHGFCNQILRREIKNLPPYTSNFTIYDTTDCKNVVKQALKKLGLDEKYYPANAIISAISKAKNELISARKFAVLAGDFHEKKIAEVYAEYENTLMRSNAVDFDDLLLLTVKLLQENPEVREKYQERFAYVMVDEYQDTNHVQYLLTKILCEKHHRLCVVGDIDQSIYGWRGADISNILDFERDYPEAKVIKLEQNYRSTQVILDAANAVIANNTERRPKNLWTDNGTGLPISYYEAADDREEASYVVETMKGLQREGKSLGDVAVLYRTNAQSRIFEENLMKNGISYVMVGSLKFYDRKEVKDILAYLRFLHNTRDAQALARIINVPKRGIGPTSVAKILDVLAENDCTVLDIKNLPDSYGSIGRAAAKVQSFVEIIEKLRESVDKISLPDLMIKIVNETDYMSEYDGEDAMQVTGRKENLNELTRIAQEFMNDDEEEKTLEAFLQHVALVADIDDAKLSDSSVTLMTLHSSKGLEFPVVFLVGMEDGLFPSQRAGDDDAALEEERRLCYVGITRAKRQLFVSSCRSRMMYGNIISYQPSRFLGEIPRNLITRVKSKRNAGFGQPRQESGLRSIAQTRGFTATPRGFVATPRNAAPPRAGAVNSTGGWGAQKPGSYTPPGDAPLDTFKAGDRVKHKAWGIGTVVYASQESDGQSIKVAFPNKGVKTLLTKLRIVDKL